MRGRGAGLGIVVALVALAVPALSTDPAAPQSASAAAWYAPALAWANEAGIITEPPGRFQPDQPLNRAQEAAALWRLAGAPTGSPAAGAPDVATTAWYAPAVDWAVDRGRVPLLPDGSFRPRQTPTRGGVAGALWRAAGTPPAGSAIEWARTTGVLRGFSDGSFRPGSPMTRGQFVVALHRLHQQHVDGPPNVVLVLTDDQTLESIRTMPRVLELLGDGGTTFANAFATFPLCCPSRATLMTGQYAHNHGVVNNVAWTQPPNAPIGGYAALDHTNSLPVWLQAGGYATAHVGKFMNCYGSTHSACRAPGPIVPPGWDDWLGFIDPFPDNYGYFDFDVSDNGTVRHIGPGPDIYQTDFLADRAVADIAHFGEQEQPFFLNIWPSAPHSGGGTTVPFAPAPAPRHTGMFTTEPAPSTPAVGETDLSDKPQYVRDIANGGWITAGLAPVYRNTLQSLQAVDEMVADVVDALDAIGELDRTVIMFTSDNGLQFGEHRLNYRKVVPYEESVHVPLLIRGPGFPAGHVADQLVGNIDLVPTIVSLAGVHAGRTMDGRPLMPLAQDPSVAQDRALLLEDWPNGSFIGFPPHYDGIRTPTDVYLEYGTGEREYYDLVSDPYQLTSRHADPTTLARRQALAAVLAQLETCAGASCQVTDPG